MESMGVVSKRPVWIEFMGVASGCVIRWYIDLLIILIRIYLPTPLVSALFCSSTILFVHFVKSFCSCLCYFCAIFK